MPFRTPGRSAIPLALAVALLAGCRADLVTGNVRDVPFVNTARALKAEVANVGSAEAGPSRTAVFTRPAAAQPYVERARTATPRLAPGQREDVVLWTIPFGETPGPNHCLSVKVCADADGAIGESNEANNCTEKVLGTAACP